VARGGRFGGIGDVERPALGAHVTGKFVKRSVNSTSRIANVVVRGIVAEHRIAEFACGCAPVGRRRARAAASSASSRNAVARALDQTVGIEQQQRARFDEGRVRVRRWASDPESPSGKPSPSSSRTIEIGSRTIGCGCPADA